MPDEFWHFAARELIFSIVAMILLGVAEKATGAYFGDALCGGSVALGTGANLFVTNLTHRPAHQQ